MKTKINPKLRKILSKHFVNQIVARVGVPISANREEITDYWLKCPKQLKHTSLCFFSKDLIDLVNKTNSKLLYADFLSKTTSVEQSSKAQVSAQTDESTEKDDYTLLNTFEMLWNIDGTAQHKKPESLQPSNDQQNTEEGKEGNEIENVAEQSIEEMNLVEILSHRPDEANQPTHSADEVTVTKDKATDMSGQVQGYALTVKEEYIDKII